MCVCRGIGYRIDIYRLFIEGMGWDGGGNIQSVHMSLVRKEVCWVR